mmetsp:Transcript_23102/g.72065  ORF Transcript_23102/g.72065 Transcript_23102/m.72065 type:complete len:209 (-) Transcript_23102:1426-2052(-)
MVSAPSCLSFSFCASLVISCSFSCRSLLATSRLSTFSTRVSSSLMCSRASWRDILVAWISASSSCTFARSSSRCCCVLSPSRLVPESCCRSRCSSIFSSYMRSSISRTCFSPASKRRRMTSSLWRADSRALTMSLNPRSISARTFCGFPALPIFPHSSPARPPPAGVPARGLLLIISCLLAAGMPLSSGWSPPPSVSACLRSSSMSWS